VSTARTKKTKKLSEEKRFRLDSDAKKCKHDWPEKLEKKGINGPRKKQGKRDILKVRWKERNEW